MKRMPTFVILAAALFAATAHAQAPAEPTATPAPAASQSVAGTEDRPAAEGEKKKWTMGIVMLGVFATALFYGDSMITPAISVLSAVEGLTTVQAGFQPYVIPTAIGILVGLFAIQSRGTAKVGLLFGPVMLVYFTTLAVLGGMHIVKHPAVLLEMLNPFNAFKFYLSEPFRAFFAMGSVVLWTSELRKLAGRITLRTSRA